MALGYGAFDNGVAIPDFVRHLYLQSGTAVERFGDPRRTGAPPQPVIDRTGASASRTSDRPAMADTYYQWLNEPVEGSAGAITRLWHAVHSSRTDLQEAFPDVFGADRPRFVPWTATFGMREYGFPDEFLNPALA